MESTAVASTVVATDMSGAGVSVAPAAAAPAGVAPAVPAAAANIFSPAYTQPSGDANVFSDNFTRARVAPPAMWGTTGIALLVALAVVLVVLVMYYMAAPSTVATALERRGWVVYYRAGCGYCTAQKKALGPYRLAVECDTSRRATSEYVGPLSCDSPEIKGFPFWYNERTKESRLGLQNITALKAMAG
jgi:hypothetical protein